MEVVKVIGIDWDTDGEEVDLPKSVTIGESPEELSDDDIIDKLSDEYGWCINGVEEIRREKTCKKQNPKNPRRRKKNPRR